MAQGISIKDMSIGWETQRVIPTLSLELAAGETLCLVGPGGSGKSTTLRVLEQLVCASAGSTPSEAPEGLWWRGECTSTFTRCTRLRQHGEFRRTPTGELLVDAGLVKREDWMPEGESERALIRAVYDLPIGEAPELLRRYISFVLVAYSDEPLLLFDEPRFGLSGPWARAVWAKLEGLAAGDQTMVIVTHYLPLARAVADQVMLIIDGRVIEAGGAEEFFERAKHPRTRQYLTWGG